MYFNLDFSFCVDLVGMVKIMQKHAKLEKKGKKPKTMQGVASSSRLEAGTSRLDQTCRQVAQARGENVDRLVREQEQQQQRTPCAG